MSRIVTGLLVAGGAAALFRVGQYAFERYGRLHGVPELDIDTRRGADVELSNRFPVVHIIAGFIAPVVNPALLEAEYLAQKVGM